MHCALLYTDGAFTKGVQLRVKQVCYDAKLGGVTKEDPFVVALTGDAARVSQRGSMITTCGAKEVDRRLPSQQGTGKVMNQSRNLYTPMLAGYISEKVTQPFPPPPFYTW